jgi:PAS domain-containing protein
MPVGNLLENIHAQPLPELHDALLVAGGAEVAALAGKGQEIFMAAVFALHAGKAVVRVATVEVPVNDLLQIRPPETVLPELPSGEIVAIYNDITDRKRAEKLLQESEEKYRLLFDASPVGIGIATPEGRILTINTASQKIFGYTEEEFKAVNIRDSYVRPME